MGQKSLEKALMTRRWSLKWAINCLFRGIKISVEQKSVSKNIIYIYVKY